MTKEQKRFNGLKIAFSTNSAEQLDIHRLKKENIDLHVMSCTKTKWIMILNIRHKTISLIEKQLGKKSLLNLRLSNEFWELTPKSYIIKIKISKPDLIKTEKKKMFCERTCSVDNKTNYRFGENICKPHIWQTTSMRLYKELSKVDK